jgi:DNA-binding beta-propeller fold protein YncE
MSAAGGGTGRLIAAANLGVATNDSPTGLFANGALVMNGRLVTPTGRITALGDLPLGIALSPDGRLAVVSNGGMGEGPGPTETLQVVDMASGGVVQTLADHLPNTDTFYNAGVVFSHDGRHVYASGGGNDTVYDYAVQGGRLKLAASWASTLKTQVTGRVPVEQVIAGTISAASMLGDFAGYSRGLDVTPDGTTVVVANEQGSSLAGIDTATGSVRWELPISAGVTAGAYPSDVAIAADGSFGVAALQGVALLVKFDPVHGTPLGTAPVGDHPTAVRLSQDAHYAYVTDANDDSLSIVDMSGAAPTLVRQLSTHLFSGEANGSTPNAVAVDDARQLVYVTNAGDDAVAVFGLPGSLSGSGVSPTLLPAATPPVSAQAPLMLPNTAPAAAPDPTRLALLGFLPTGLYPAAVAVAGDGTIAAVSAKGYGGLPVTTAAQSDKTDMVGLLQQIPLPTASSLASATQQARADVAFASAVNSRRAPDNPIPDAAHAGQSPIKHVVLIVRENRTFDQVFGDVSTTNAPVHRAGVDGDPRFVEFPMKDAQNRTITVNAHDIAAQFGMSDNFYSDGDASIQGHHWTAGGITTDYVEKSWVQYYSNRNHPYDTTLPIAYARCGAIFQQLAAHNISFRNFGELEGLATIQPTTLQVAPDSQCPIEGGTQDAVVAANSNVTTYGNNLTLTSMKDTARFTAFKNDYDTLTTLGKVPAFSYLIMGNDHTDGTTPGKSTPQALVATNDQAIGQVVDYLSHRSDWNQTAVFIEEDDSQDGMDHRDGHRNILLVASPYATPGKVSHVHISQASVMHTIELILGLPSLTSYTQTAPVPYDLFQAQTTMNPYAMVAPTYPQGAINPPAAAGTAAAYHIDTSQVDVAGPMLEAQLWQATRPGEAIPPALAAELAARSGVSASDLAAWTHATPGAPLGGDAGD